jgi:hypothetical protein
MLCHWLCSCTRSAAGIVWHISIWINFRSSVRMLATQSKDFRRSQFATDVTKQIQAKSPASRRSCAMTQMGYLWEYFEYFHPSRIEAVSRVTCQIEAPSFRCESYWFIKTSSLGSRYPPHIHCEGKLQCRRQAVPQVAGIRSPCITSGLCPLTLLGFPFLLNLNGKSQNRNFSWLKI